jgi:putative membrane protein
LVIDIKTPAAPLEKAALGLTFIGVATWSAVDPADNLTWWLEALPAILLFLVLAVSQHKFPLTRITVWAICALLLMMVVGAHYTYSGVPLFDWLKQTLDLTRNHYDRVSHVLQGVTVSLLAREITRRTIEVRRSSTLFALIILATLGVSAGCELIEWLAAEIFDDGATEFLGMQGDVWDAQKDMGLALIGAFVTIGLFRRVQDRQIDGT